MTRRAAKRPGWAGWWRGVAAAAVAGAMCAAAEDAATPIFLWELRGLQSTSYLLGSLHAAHADVYPLPDIMDAAFGSCDTLVVEADIGARPESEIMTMVLEQAANRGGKPLRELLDDDSAARLDEVLSRHGLNLAAMSRFRPWYVAQTISLLEMKRLGMQPEHGIDRYFLDRARGDKLILELEGVRQQLALFSGLSDREQGLLLEYTLRDVENLATMLDDIATAWRTGDADGLDRLLNGYLVESRGLEDVFKKVFHDRNQLMAAKIRDYLRTDRTYFIVVGAGHLVGDDGLLRLLMDGGVNIRQLKQAPVPAPAG